MSGRFKANADNIDEDEEDDDDNGVIKERENENFKNKKRGRLPFGGCSYRRAKKVAFSPINKFQVFYKRYKRSSSSSATASTIFSHQTPNLSRNSTKHNNYSCCLCMSKPQNLDTDYDGIDPSDPNVSFDYFKSLIEKNDFYSKECNTHIG